VVNLSSSNRLVHYPSFLNMNAIVAHMFVQCCPTWVGCFICTDACVSGHLHRETAVVRVRPIECPCLFAAACVAALFARAEAHVAMASIAVEIVLLECSEASPAIHLVTAAGRDRVPTRARHDLRVANTGVPCRA